MSYHEQVSAMAADAQQMEQLFRAATEVGETDEFKEAIDESYASAPENLLYAAWFYRLKQGADHLKSFAIAWPWVIPLAIINGLLFWLLSDDQRFMLQTVGVREETTRDYLPTILLLAAPLSAICLLIYLTVVGRSSWLRGLLAAFVTAAATVYVLWIYPQLGTRPYQEQYLTLMVLHLPLLAWACIGAFLTAGQSSPANRFSFLIKSLEVIIMGGLFVSAGGLFTGISVGLFAALDVNFSDLVMRLFIAGGGGLIPVVATAVIYDPTVSPAEQAFGEGLSKLVALLMRILLPLTLLVLLVYLAFIPFNFREPFDNRDVLIIYNGMLFAVIALFVGATPVSLANISPRLGRWLRLIIIAVAALALIISLYALAAIIYRTVLDRLTPNRLAFTGWNGINIGLLVLVLLFQARAKGEQWLPGLYRAYSVGTVAYSCWTLAMVLALPWLFGINQGEIDSLPPAVQDIVYEHAQPILLKCADSPHIYLLEGGTKRWVDNIETFNDRGYVWRDVRFIACEELRNITNGVPIPADSGPPPVP